MNTDITNTRYYKYAEDVISGKQKAGELIKLACERFMRDLKDDRFIFKKEEADRPIRFIQMFKHYSSKSAGKQFILEGWQTFYLANIYGFYWAERPKERRFSMSYLQVSRKQGKSALASVLALYALLGEGEPDAQILFCASTREQAHIAFNMSSAFAKQIDPKGKYLHYTKSDIKKKNKTDFMKVLASEANSLDGYNPSCVIADEIHAYKDNSMIEVMRSGMGFRQSPLIQQISTAGFDLNGYGKEVRDLGADVVKGDKHDETYFFMIYEIDEDDDWKAEENWIKCCPNLGITVNVERMREYVVKAENQPSDRTAILTKNFNVWCDAKQTWIENEFITNSMRKVDWEEFRGQDVYIGVDLSMVRDLTAVSFMFINEDNMPVFKTLSFLPSETQAKEENFFIKNRVREKEIIITPGNVIDYNYIIAKIKQLEDDYNMYIQLISYDRFNATQWAIQMTDMGYNLLDFNQGLGSFNRPTKEFERLCLSDKVIMDKSTLVRYCFGCVFIKADMHGNIKPDKLNSSFKIDPVIAMLQALGGYLNNCGENYAIFNM